jgi:hypothetical protein
MYDVKKHYYYYDEDDDASGHYHLFLCYVNFHCIMQVIDIIYS